ncbi:MAG: hypothetical protein JNL72_03340 [Flavipsychrobacter sp.]|nr:hypothetical protein [Flavipsychrobacter sp.]
MRSLLKWMSGTLAIVLLLALPVTKVQAQYYDDDYVSYQTFYDDLSPHGQWVFDPQYGNVWVPDVGNDFRPYYTNGHWAMTDYGNTWVSNYSWGWAPFHYGRWTYNPFYGWVWIPGNTWGPAWVSWRWGGGQCGWAPMGPGININVSIGNYNCPNDWWVFVGPQHLYQRNFHNYWRGPRYNTTFINQTTIINNTYNNTYVYGPRARQIEEVTHQRVNVHRIAGGGRGASQVRGNTVNMYRPQIRGNASEGRPTNVVRAPRNVGEMQGGVRNERPEFKTMVSRGEVRPVNGNNPRNGGGREQRFDGAGRNEVRPGGGREQGFDRPRGDEMRNGNTERGNPGNRQMVRPDRQPLPTQERPEQRPQQVDRPYRPDRSQMQPGRPDQRPQQTNRPQRMERPQQQRIERPQQVDRPQRVERPQQMERQQMQQRPQQQRMERPQMQQRPQQSPQRMERQQMQPRPQQAPRPQPQQQRMERGGGSQQSRPSGMERGGRR